MDMKAVNTMAKNQQIKKLNRGCVMESGIVEKFKMEWDIKNPAIVQSEEETDILLKAQGEIINNGNTEIICPRCGRGLEYRFFTNSSSSIIKCERPDCVSVSVRGI